LLRTFLRHGNAQQKNLIRKSIEQGGLNDISEVIQAVKETGALDYVRSIAETEAKLACQAIEKLPKNQHYQSLIDLAHFAVNRSY
jgi:octaprenyl-diphosphate synthase